MDEWTLNDLLECSVCLERLDTSSKVLPCQHTFCKKCLEEILATKQELRCPECRVVVTVSIDELPPNVLLMRILEGIMRSGNSQPKPRGQPVTKLSTAMTPPTTVAPHPNTVNTETLVNRPITGSKQVANPGMPMARALYDYQSQEPGYLSFKKGDLITLRNKIDSHYCDGECSGRTGIFPLPYVQVITPLPPQAPTARALYDFRMNNDEEEGCLSFKKDEIVAVLRRVDENWVEGRLGARVGIFPLAFVELNAAARALMKLSSNEQPGPSRMAPPTPTSDESTPLIPMDSRAEHVVGQNTASENNLLNALPARSSSTNPVVTANPRGSDSSSTSTTTPNSSTSSSSSSSSSTGPSSPVSPPIQQPQQQQPQSLNPFIRPQTILLPTSHITTQPRDKRHSFSALTPSQPPPNSNRHSAEILSSTEPTASALVDTSVSGSQQRESCSSSHVPAPVLPRDHASQLPLVRQGSQRHKRSGSDFAVVTLPAAYVALYPYKPQKADELELKKGGVYLVSERCQDGWFKGTSNRTQKCGVFPGNYVTLAKPAQNSHRVASSSPRDSSIPPPLSLKVRSISAATCNQGMLQSIPSSLAPPELPPRAASPAPRLQRHHWTAQHAHSPPVEHGNAMSEVPSVPAPLAPSKSESTPRHVSNTVTPPPNVSVSLSPITPKSADKTKDKKEKSGLMKRLAAMKRSKSPTPPTYSMDNPVFDDSPVVISTNAAVSTPGHSAHSRSGSCPSQLVQVLPQTRVLSASQSARLKSKERPSVASVQFAHASSRMGENGSTPSGVAGSVHRKSSSLDAGDTRSGTQLLPPVRERFRCIVPYPPNSQYELELRVGDIIYVHRKRDDGWYKGTQQRTGRTGLFPASFVETY